MRRIRSISFSIFPDAIHGGYTDELPEHCPGRTNLGLEGCQILGPLWKDPATGEALYAEVVVDQGFTELFNGQNFTGWERKLKAENVDSGATQALKDELRGKVFGIDAASRSVYMYKMLNGDGLDEDPFNNAVTQNLAHGMLYTNRSDYSRYVLRWEYKWGTNTNNNWTQRPVDAGVYFHVKPGGNDVWPASGYEYQIMHTSEGST